jgi:uncharacterized membrane protein
VRKVQAEKVLSELSDVRGRVLRSSLSPDQEKRLQEALMQVSKDQESAGSAPAN